MSDLTPVETHGDLLEKIPERLGDFRLIERLGGGGMGVVYVAEQLSLRRIVALKLIRPESLFFEGARERFRREAEAVARLQHPGIVPVLTFGEEAGIPYFAMERVAGMTLADVLHRLEGRDAKDLDGSDLHAIVAGPDRGAPDAGFAGTWVQVSFRLIRQVADALEHAHRRGVIHRDVKPSNIMLTPDGRALLLDFGVSTSATSRAESGQARLTRSGSFVGSLMYSPPEQVRGDLDAISPALDVYALGVTLYELLTLRAPFLGDTIDELQRAIVEGQPQSPRETNAAVPWDAETVCLAAMDPDRRRRYAGAGEFAQDLANVLELRPIAAKRASVALRMRRWVQRHPTLFTALVALVLLTIVGPSVAWIRIRAERDRANAARDEAARQADVARRVTEFFVSALRGADPASGAGDITMREFLRRIRDEVAGKDFAPETRAVLLSHLGDISLNLGDVQAALPMLDDALALHRELFGESSQQTAGIYVLRARAAIALGRIDDAIREASAAIAACSGSKSLDPAMLSTAESVLGTAHLSAGRFSEAIAAFRRVVDRQRSSSDTDAKVAMLGALATAQLYSGDSESAEATCREALAIEAANPGRPPGIDAASIRNTLAMIRKRERDLDEAERLYGEAAAIYQRLGLDRHPDLGTILNNRAIVLEERGDLEAAGALLESALAIANSGGPGTASAAQIEMELGLNCARRALADRAELHLRSALDTMRAAKGADPYYRAVCARRLAESLLERERVADAHALFVESLEAYNASGRNEPGVVERLEHLVAETAGG